MQQIETIMELLDELRDSEKRRQVSSQAPVPQKKQIHFSDNSEYFDGASSEAVIREREKALPIASSAAFKSVKHELSVLPNRRHRKSIANSDIITESSTSSSSLSSVDKISHLLTRYSQLKKHLE